MTAKSSFYFEYLRPAPGACAAIMNHPVVIANSGFVDLGEGVLVFDTTYSVRAATELRQFAEEATGKPVTHLVYSHFHMDHVSAHRAFDGIASYATEKTRDLIADRWQADRWGQDQPKLLAAWQEHRDSFASQNDERGASECQAILDQLAALPMPEVTHTFDSSLTLQGSARTVELHTFGGGHTPSDALLILPEEGIAYTGDLLVVQRQPYIMDGNVFEWIEILEKMESLDVRTFVPGHGPLGTKQDVALLKDYFHSLIDQAENALKKGQPAGDVDIRRPALLQNFQEPVNISTNFKYIYDIVKASQTSPKGN